VSSIPITIGIINGSKKFERCMEHPNEIKRVVSSIPIAIGINGSENSNYIDRKTDAH